MSEHPIREAREHIERRVPAFRHFLMARLRRGHRYGLGFTIGFIITAVCLGLFLFLIDSVLDQGAMYRFDLRIQDARDRIVSPTLTAWVVFITNLGGGTGTAVGSILLSLVLLFRRRWWAMLGLVIATGVGGLVVMGLKLLFQRARPLEQLIDVGG